MSAWQTDTMDLHLAWNHLGRYHTHRRSILFQADGASFCGCDLKMQGSWVQRLGFGNGASLLREGSNHSIFQKGQHKSQIPRHNEIVDELARKICKDLGISFVR